MTNDSPSEDVYRAYFRFLRDQGPDGGSQMLRRFDEAVQLGAKKPPEAGSPKAAAQARAIIGVLREDAELGKAVLDAGYSALRTVGALDHETRQFLALIADKHGRLEQAERFYRLALRDGDIENEATLYLGLLRVLSKQHKYEEIVQECRLALKTSRNTRPFLFHSELARTLPRLGKLQEAEISADQAIQNAADSQRLYATHLKVRVLTMARQFEKAEAITKKLLEESLIPGDVQDIRYVLSGIYSAWKKMDKCEEQLQKILEFDPANATANNDLGYIWADQGKHLPEAEVMVRKAIELDREQRKIGPNEDRDNAAYVDSLGWVLFRRGDVEGARRELERAVALPDGDDAALWDHLADVYFRLERYNQALSAWERSVELYQKEHARPQDERYRDVQRKLKTVRELVRAP